LRELIDRDSQHAVERILGVDVLAVVEHQAGLVEPRIKVTEVIARERLHVPRIGGFELRQRLGSAPLRLHRLREIEKERGDVGIPAVHLVPEALQPPCGGVVRNQRGLAATRGSNHPHHRRRVGFVQLLEQARA